MSDDRLWLMDVWWWCRWWWDVDDDQKDDFDEFYLQRLNSDVKTRSNTEEAESNRCIIKAFKSTSHNSGARSRTKKKTKNMSTADFEPLKIAENWDEQWVVQWVKISLNWNSAIYHSKNMGYFDLCRISVFFRCIRYEYSTKNILRNVDHNFLPSKSDRNVFWFR